MTASNSHMFSLHRYFLWSDRLKTNFLNTLNGQSVQELINKKQASFETNMAMSYWYASTYVVIEGWRELGLDDSEINGMLESPYAELLKQYRKSVCHFQKNYFDQNYFFLIKEGRTAAEWMFSLSSAFDRYFKNWLNSIRDEEKTLIKSSGDELF